MNINTVIELEKEEIELLYDIYNDGISFYTNDCGDWNGRGSVDVMEFVQFNNSMVLRNLINDMMDNYNKCMNIIMKAIELGIQFIEFDLSDDLNRGEIFCNNEFYKED